MNVWQIAAGDGSRDYADLFLKFGVILVGPGSEGSYFNNKSFYINSTNKSYGLFMPTFAEKVKIDDLVVLKRPSGVQWEIIAVGKVISDYFHTETFGDVDGWDLQHCRQIEWKTPHNQTIINGLRRGTLFLVNKNNAISEIQNVWNNGKNTTSQVIPKPVDEITVDELIDSIMSKGISIANSEHIANTIWKLRRIAKWYSHNGSDVGEHEIRTFLIVPLFTSVGWAEQKIKIEWCNIDVAIFDSPYSSNSTPVLLIESKRLGHGLLDAPKQAKQYATKYPSCSLFVVSDGIRYKLYELDSNNKWIFTAYMNLMSPQKNHPYESNVKGAVDFFLKIMK